MKPTNLEGQIRNFDLKRGPVGQLALNEAISNAQFAIEDRNLKAADGRIEIVVHHLDAEGQLPLQDGDRPIEPVSDIEIIDNGVGFNDRHYESFDQCDTMLRAGRGGRGIGRLTYLVAFSRVEIESHFQSDGKWVCRRFSFAVNEPGHVTAPVDCESPHKAYRTVVRLCDLRDEHRRSLPIHLDRLADRIIGHWMKQFVRNHLCPITLRDAATGDSLSLQTRFQREFLINHAAGSVEIKGTAFSVEHVLIAAKEKRHAAENEWHEIAERMAGATEREIGAEMEVWWTRQIRRFRTRLRREHERDWSRSGY
jgi:hypothetical protein